MGKYCIIHWLSVKWSCQDTRVIYLELLNLQWHVSPAFGYSLNEESPHLLLRNWAPFMIFPCCNLLTEFDLNGKKSVSIPIIIWHGGKEGLNWWRGRGWDWGGLLKPFLCLVSPVPLLERVMCFPTQKEDLQRYAKSLESVFAGPVKRPL